MIVTSKANNADIPIRITSISKKPESIPIMLNHTTCIIAPKVLAVLQSNIVNTTGIE